MREWNPLLTARLVTLYFQGFTGTTFGNPFSGNWWVWLPVIGVNELEKRFIQ